MDDESAQDAPVAAASVPEAVEDTQEHIPAREVALEDIVCRLISPLARTFA